MLESAKDDAPMLIEQVIKWDKFNLEIVKGQRAIAFLN